MVSNHDNIFVCADASEPLRRTIEEMDVDKAIEKLVNPPQWIHSEELWSVIDRFFPYIQAYKQDLIILQGWILNTLDDPKADMKAIEAALYEEEEENFYQFLQNHGYKEFLARYLDQNRPQGTDEGSMRL